MKKTGLADSPFFTPSPKTTATPPLASSQAREKEKTKRKKPVRKESKPSRHETLTPNNRDTMTPSNHETLTPNNRDTMTPSNHETMVSRYHDTIIEQVRKAVKELGKEAATHRFTIAEKNAIADIIYTYKSHGVRTSENEIARIAVNFIIEDYRENGENSILEKTLKALNE